MPITTFQDETCILIYSWYCFFGVLHSKGTPACTSQRSSSAASAALAVASPEDSACLEGGPSTQGTILEMRYAAVNPLAMQAVFKSLISSAIFPKLADRSWHLSPNLIYQAEKAFDSSRFAMSIRPPKLLAERFLPNGNAQKRFHRFVAAVRKVTFQVVHLQLPFAKTS